jgi:hypothetical protein
MNFHGGCGGDGSEEDAALTEASKKIDAEQLCTGMTTRYSMTGESEEPHAKRCRIL